jgi:hypothetical protein
MSMQRRACSLVVVLPVPGVPVMRTFGSRAMLAAAAAITAAAISIPRAGVQVTSGEALAGEERGARGAATAAALSGGRCRRLQQASE